MRRRGSRLARGDDDARLSAKDRKVAPKKSSRRVKKADNGGPAVEVQVYVQTHEEGTKSKMELAVEAMRGEPEWTWI